jgi:hypothetical protein
VWVPEPQRSALEAAGVDLSDLNLTDPEDLFAALRRITNQSRLETWRAGRIPPHMRQRLAGAKDSLSTYRGGSPPRPGVSPGPDRDRAAVEGSRAPPFSASVGAALISTAAARRRARF